MNIEKIRRALNDAEKHFIGYGRAAVAKQMEDALAELDKVQQDACGWDKCPHGSECVHAKAQQPGEVLTDEEIQDIATECFGDMLNKTALKDLELKGMAVTCSNYETALRFARDNGYLSPAAGLTVDEVMEIVGPMCFGDATIQSVTEKLAAAINAKAAKQ